MMQKIVKLFGVLLLLCNIGFSQEYWPAQITIYNSLENITDEWLVNYDFDIINDQVWFNIMPNDNEEFTLVYVIKSARAYYDKDGRWEKTCYGLNDGAKLCIWPIYIDNPQEPSMYDIILTDTLKWWYANRRVEIKFRVY